jgi:hypothetical protein
VVLIGKKIERGLSGFNGLTLIFIRFNPLNPLNPRSIFMSVFINGDIHNDENDSAASNSPVIL